jgi:glycosyltransferase involved in cell wall biosynthesis
VDYQWAFDISDEDVVQKYRESDLVVFCSTHEGFGMPIIEANATGRPVVTSDLDPMVNVANGAACLVDPYNVSSIREGIQRILGDVGFRNELIRRGLENAIRFNPSVIAASYEQLYLQKTSL